MMDYQETIEILRYGLEIPEQIPHLVEPYKAAISAMQELQEYMKLGTLEEMKLLKATHLTGVELAGLYCALKKLNEYEKLGTLEELKELVELRKKERPMEVLGILGGKEHECRNCGNTVSYMDDYCKWCGQAQDWSEEE